MTLERYNMPVKLFYGNMLKIGLKFKVKDGQLKVGGNKDALTPVLKDEIAKRAELLIDLLTPPPSEEMERYFGRLLVLKELGEALRLAEMLNEKVDSLPVNGGWILTTGKEVRP